MNLYGTQRNRVLEHLKKRGPLTQLEALDRYGCLRLGARVYELREAGYAIETRRKAVKTRAGRSVVAEYVLA